MKRTAIYIRVSTQEQALEGFSLAAQTQKLNAYCESQDWQVVGIYADEGISAKDTHRPKLQQLLQDIAAGNIDIVLVYKLDRLTRSVSDLYQLLQLFDKYQVGFKSATEIFDTTTAIGRLFITMVAAMAQWERETIGERVAIGMAQKALEGKRVAAAAPFGYTKNGETLAVNPTEAQVVREIFHRYVNGDSIDRITRWLRTTDARGGIWDNHTVSYLLENPVYIGKIRWGYRSAKTSQETILTDGSHEPIVNLATWQAAQHARERRKRRSPRAGTGKFPFGGLLWCAKCGASMTGQYNRKYRYYRCNKARLKQCNARMVRADLLEAAVVDALQHHIQAAISELTIDLDAQRGQPRDTAKVHESLLARKRRLLDAYELGGVTLDELRVRLARLEDDLLEITDTRHASVDAASIERRAHLIHARASDFRAGWHSLSTAQQRELLQQLIGRIEVVGTDVQITLRDVF
ncbi:integrase [Alicyclobacillus acidoterrestris]|nr:integrase [Alicyclobacillus acidoterrestris]